MVSWLEAQYRQKIIQISKRLYSNGWLAACDGNISARLPDGRILITPSGKPKADLFEYELCLLNSDGKILSGNPSSEMWMHLTVYQNCEKAQSVVHAHPPQAIAWSIAHPELKELPSEACSELILAMGGVPFADYARPGTKNMGEVLLPFLPKHRVLILRNHGALCWGENLDEAFIGIERLEHSAKLLHLAEISGGIHSLPAEEVKVLREMRKKIGEQIL